ncbi:MAG: GH92 family glycosyl hydrolase [Bacteroidota bacterium]
MIRISLILFVAVQLIIYSCTSHHETIWQIGYDDNSAVEFSLAPDQFENFIENDFGWEDNFYLVGFSNQQTDFPYVLPGPADTWGGTWPTSGWRTNEVNVLFGLKKTQPRAGYKLVIQLTDFSKKFLPLVKVTINGQVEKFQLESEGYDLTQQPKYGLRERYTDNAPVAGHPGATPATIEIDINPGELKPHGNRISVTVLEGSWIMFDFMELKGPSAKLPEPGNVFVRNVTPADYEIHDDNGNVQPLLIDVEHLSGLPLLEVRLDGKLILAETIEKGRYVFEAPMPAVSSKRTGKYEVLIDGKRIQKGRIARTPEMAITPAGYASTMMGTAHSRWMIAPGPWMPFSMVKISPNNQNAGWQAGYDPIFENIAGFSHIHEWTLGGLLMMPTNGELQTQVGDERKPDEGYRSRINKQTEEAPIGYYKADLTDYGITAELTATTRCSFQRYTFPKDKEGSRVLIDLQIPAEYTYLIEKAEIKKVSDYRIEGFSQQLTPNTWAGGISQEYIIHFVIEFDQPVKSFGVWSEHGVQANTDVLQLTGCKDAGAFAEFDTRENQVVQVRTGISYVSIENADLNLTTEITTPFGWDFEAVRQNQSDTWNKLFGRLKITSNDRREKLRFYSNMYRSLCSRNTYSDVDGKWVDADETIRQLPDPDSPALGCDAFWNTFWNLNQFWNLVTPEWSNRWVNSQLAMYAAGGWLAKGPAGMEYIPVMVAEHEIPLIVGAYQMGIRDFDVEKAFEAVKKMQTTPGTEVGGGYAGNRDLVPYLKHKYVPYDLGRFSNSLEYSYDDWTVGQFAKALGKEEDYQEFKKRGEYWRNVIDPGTGYARMKDSKGNWLEDFDPFKSGANYHYVEGNAWQLTYFVPQDVPALAGVIGKDTFIDRLTWGFEESYKTRFNGMNDQYWNYPVVQGNQQSMHFAFLFNWVGRPWQTQEWSRAIIDRYYGYGVANAYLGDEDQGQMSAWFIMAALGLFQTDGGCRVDPVYEIGSPLYQKVEIDLGQRYGRGKTFTIEAKNASRLNRYVQSAMLNGKPLRSFSFPASELLGGGSLVLEMGPEPNKNWGTE